MTTYKHKALIKQCINIVPSECNTQCTDIVSNICNTSPLKEKFWRPRGYKILQKYTYVQVITFLKTSLSKYKSKIGTMCNLHKLTNYRYTNYTSNTASGQSISVQMPHFTFSKSYLHTEFLSLTVF